MPEITTRDALTVALAERAMGWLHWDTEGDWSGPENATFFAVWEEGAVAVYENGSDDPTFYWSPTQSWSDAGMLVDAMRAKEYHLKLNAFPVAKPGCEYDATFGKACFCGSGCNDHYADAATGPLAISLACAAALGLTVRLEVSRG